MSDPRSTDYEVWREVWKITERRNGCVYKTEYVENRWVPMGAHGDGGDLIYASPNKHAESLNPRRKKAE